MPLAINKKFKFTRIPLKDQVWNVFLIGTAEAALATIVQKTQGFHVFSAKLVLVACLSTEWKQLKVGCTLVRSLWGTVYCEGRSHVLSQEVERSSLVGLTSSSLLTLIQSRISAQRMVPPFRMGLPSLKPHLQKTCLEVYLLRGPKSSGQWRWDITLV